jgi:hypothetical protein
VQIDYLRHVYDAYPLPVAWKYEALADALAGMVKRATFEPGGTQPDAVCTVLRGGFAYFASAQLQCNVASCTTTCIGRVRREAKARARMQAARWL